MNELHEGLTSFAFCWQLERRDGAGLAVTSHDRTLRVDDCLFEPARGLELASIRRGVLDQPAAESEGAVSADGLTESDLLSGRWDGAAYKLIGTQWRETSIRHEELARGELGNVVLHGSSFQADLLPCTAKLNEDVCPKTSPECRANLGDKRCRVDLAGRRVRASALSLVLNELATDVSSPARFAQGTLLWLSGLNCGLRSAIVSVEGDVLHLREAPPFEVAAGEKMELTEGCDRQIETCRDRFANVANFRGEPHIPGNDLLTRYPGS